MYCGTKLYAPNSIRKSSSRHENCKRIRRELYAPVRTATIELYAPCFLTMYAEGIVSGHPVHVTTTELYAGSPLALIGTRL